MQQHTADKTLGQWHSCRRWEKSFRACPYLASSTLERRRREESGRETPDNEEPEESGSPRIQEEWALRLAIRFMYEGSGVSIPTTPEPDGTPSPPPPWMPPGVRIPFPWRVPARVPVGVPGLVPNPKVVSEWLKSQIPGMLGLPQPGSLRVPTGVFPPFLKPNEGSSLSPALAFSKSSNEIGVRNAALGIGELFTERLLMKVLSIFDGVGIDFRVPSTTTGSSQPSQSNSEVRKESESGLNRRQIAGLAGASALGAGALASGIRGGGGRPSGRGGFGGLFFRFGARMKERGHPGFQGAQ